jgi:hypothetical protein
MFLDARRPFAILARLAVLAGAAFVAGCGGGYSSNGPSYNAVNADVSRLLSSVDAIGVGGATLISNNPARADLALQSNLAGGSAQLRFSCSGCNISVEAAGATVGANQYLTIAFPTLDAASDATVTVTDNVSGAKATYTLHAKPLDHVRYSLGTVTNPSAGELYLTPFDPQRFGASYAYIVANDGSLKYYYRSPASRPLFDFKKTVIPGNQVRYSFYDSGADAIRVMDGSFNRLAEVQALPFPDGSTYAVDLHDHVIVDDGHTIIGVRATKIVNDIPSLVGQSLQVRGAGLQEIVNGVAVFSWLSTDHPELYACSTDGNNYAAGGASRAHDVMSSGSVLPLASARSTTTALTVSPR